MVRRTISLSSAIDQKVQKLAEEEGSYSAAVAKLIELGSKRTGKDTLPDFIGSFDGPPDLSENLDKYIREAIRRGHRR